MGGCLRGNLVVRMHTDRLHGDFIIDPLASADRWHLTWWGKSAAGARSRWWWSTWWWFGAIRIPLHTIPHPPPARTPAGVHALWVSRRCTPPRGGRPLAPVPAGGGAAVGTGRWRRYPPSGTPRASTRALYKGIEPVEGLVKIPGGRVKNPSETRYRASAPPR